MKRALDAERRERDIQSVKALRALLREVAAKPAPFRTDANLKSMLASQGALAKHADPSRGISAMSLNTQKLVAEIALGSYDVLDRLRKGASESLESEIARGSKSNKSTKQGLRRRTEELEGEVSLLAFDLGQMTHAWARLVSVASAMADELGTEAAVIRWRKELRSIEAGLSLRKKPMPDSNVVSINVNSPAP